MPKQVWWGFAVYCLLAGSTWLALAYLAPVWPELLRLFVHDALLCVAFALAALVRRDHFAWRYGLEAGCWCGLLFAGAPLLAAAAGGSVSSLTQVLIFCMVPAFTVFLMNQRSSTRDEMRLLVPILAGIGGLGLLLPFELPANPVGWSWFIALVGFAAGFAFAGIRLHELVKNQSLLPVAAAGSGVAAVLACLGWRAFQAGPLEMHASQMAGELVWAVIVDGTLALAMLWLVKRCNPVAFSTRFLLIPWVTIVGGLIVMRQQLGWTSSLGLLLAAGAAVYVSFEYSESSK